MSEEMLREEAQAAQAVDETAEEVDPVEEFRKQMSSLPGEWYVLHTYSGYEKRVKQDLEVRMHSMNMEDYIFETIVPTEEVVEVRNNTRKTVTRCVLPGYVLVRMELTDDSWATVRHTPSVTGFVGHGQTPIPLSLDEVVSMLTPSVVAKVAADKDGSIPDSTVLAALDDAVIIKPDSINLSLGDDAGWGSEAGTVYAEVYKNLAEAGVSVPGDVSVAGFDDVPIAAYAGPGLTTVRQDFADLGRCALEAVSYALDGESVDTYVRPTRLVVRGSTGVCPR